MKLLRRISAVTIGLVFLVSALAKLSDPVGTGLICEAYFRWMHLGFLAPVSKAFGFCLSLAEAVVGAALVTSVWRKAVAWVTMSMLLVFNVLSLLLLVLNPQMDCGCFGQLIHLTHLQTFLKNVVLALLCFPAFVPVRDLGRPSKSRFVGFGLACVTILAYGIFALMSNPLLDKMDFKPSTTLMLEDNVPADTDYKFLTVLDGQGRDVSEILLHGDVDLVTVYDPEKLSRGGILRIADFAQTSMDAGHTPLLLSSGALDVPGIENYYADRRLLLTMNRTNGGYTYVKDGYIVLKRSSFPDFDSLEAYSSLVPEDLYIKTASQNTIATQLLGIVLLVFLLLI